MSDCRTQEAFFVALCGNIGVGKSLFAERVGARMGLPVYYEPVSQNPYLEIFYRDMRRWAFHLQIYFLAERFKAQKAMNLQGRPFIQDRTIYEDGEIFARVLHERGEMERQDYESYLALFREMVDLLARPALLIYLKASTPTRLARIAERGRACEAQIEPRYLEQLEAAYRDWIRRIRAECPVLEVDTEWLHYPPGPDVLDPIIARIHAEADRRGVDLSRPAGTRETVGPESGKTQGGSP
jgi:deoxyadenosine/deoxycytidine kinase